ncbi:hypothetical protein B0H10DRAFT_2105026 [Mycena sp. CBHHK59/15]|nr:hypothetical protein B0H10DRAFT_2105026 [Mycena sp. CBHHK59/15]
MVIQLLYPNSCSNPEEIRKYNKDFRLGPERVQESRAPCQFPSTLDFAYGGLRTRLTRPKCDPSPRASLFSNSSSSSRESTSSDESETPESSPDPSGFHRTSPSVDNACALVPTFDINNRDPTLRLLFRVMLGPGITLRTPTMDDIVPEINYGTAVYHIRDTYLQHIFDSFDKLVAAIHCAGNNHSPRRNGDGLHIPMSLPKQGLKELGTLMPVCACFISRNAQRILFSEREGATYITIWPLPDCRYDDLCAEEPSDQFLRMYLMEQGLDMEDLDTSVMSEEDGDVSWNGIDC